LIKRFIGQKLTDVRTGEGGCPVCFSWGGREYRVVELLKQWQDYDYSPLAPRRDWRTRRHRNAFHVRAESGDYFELTCDRGTKLGAPKIWTLQAVLEPEKESSGLQNTDRESVRPVKPGMKSKSSGIC
jgi:hypothetical protein